MGKGSDQPLFSCLVVAYAVQGNSGFDAHTAGLKQATMAPAGLSRLPDGMHEVLLAGLDSC